MRPGPVLRIGASKSFFTPQKIAKRLFFGVVGPCGPGPYRRTTGRREAGLAGTANAELAGKANAEKGGIANAEQVAPI